MVKKHKSGRRQILQLEDKKPPPPIHVARSNKVKSLIHYSDSDDDSKSNTSLPDISVSSASATTTAAPMDSEVADFFKEIDALSVPVDDTADNSASVKEETSPSSTDDTAKQSKKTDESSQPPSESANGSAKTDASEVYCLWQACLDESSGYNYFWNVQTNEVTWECPPEYAAYLEYLSSSSATTSKPSKKSKGKQKVATKKEQKPSPYLKEGAIIPISYFGDSSASSDSNESSDCSSAKKDIVSSSVAQPPTKSKPQSKSKSKKATGERMGPQLPPNFQFRTEIPVSPSQSDKGTASKTEAPCIIGPQLPPTFFVEQKAKSSESFKKTEVEDSSPDEADKQQPDAEVESSDTSNWEESLLDIEKEFKANTKNLAYEDYTKHVTEAPDSTTKKVTEAPDSTTKKELSTAKKNVAVSTISGNPVVEYDSFTDSEEEMEVVCSSSTVVESSKNDDGSTSINTENKQTLASDEELKISIETSEIKANECSLEEDQITVEPMEADKGPIEPIEADNGPIEPIEADKGPIEPIEADKGHIEPMVEDKEHIEPMVEVTPLNEEKKNSESNSSISIAESPEACVPFKKPNNEVLNDMFSNAKESFGKFGFGFSRSQQLDLENEPSDEPRPRKRKRNKNYPMISFVKSKKILEFTDINDCKDSQPVARVTEEYVPMEEESIVEPVLPEIVAKVDDTPESVPSISTTSDSENKSTVDEPVISVDIADSQDIKVEKEPKKQSDNKKVKTKKKSSKKEIKAPKVEQPEDPVASTDGVDDIDQLLGNILKEMVESGEAKAAATMDLKVDLNDKSKDETKKRPSESPANPVKKKKKKEDVKKSAEKDPDVTANIISLSTELMEKISFLVTNHTAMASLSSVLVQVQTRLMDWQAGCLDAKYFMDRLQDVHQYLQQCELSIMPNNWTCQWDSEHKRYFYVDAESQLSQWIFPTEVTVQEAIVEKSVWDDGSIEVPLSSSTTNATTHPGMQFPLVSSSMPEEQILKSNGCVGDAYLAGQETNRGNRIKLRESSPPPPPPGVDTPPPAEPPPPITPPPPPDSPPPPPPDCAELEEGELPDVDMELEDSNSEDSISFAVGYAGTNRETSPRKIFMECSSTASPEHRTPLFPLSIISSTNVGVLSTVSQLPQSTLSYVSQNFSTMSVPSVQNPQTSPPSSGFSCSSSGADTLPTSSKTVSLPSTSRVTEDSSRRSPVDAASVATSSSSVSKSVTSSSNGSATSISKKEKEKKKSKLHTGLSFKKRNIPSLVQKWQKIKEEQDKEDKDSDEQKILASLK